MNNILSNEYDVLRGLIERNKPRMCPECRCPKCICPVVIWPYALLILAALTIFYMYRVIVRLRNRKPPPCPICPEPEPLPIPLPTITRREPPVGCSKMLSRPFQPGDDPVLHSFCSGGVGLRL